jgi:hypothetical protein
MKSTFNHSSYSDKNKSPTLINRFLLLLVLLFVQPGCNPVEVDQPQKFVSGEPFELKVRDIMSINDNLLFAIDSIHDGRCPVGLNCIWGGDAYLYFKIKHNNSFIDTMICKNYCHNNPFDFAGYTFKVLDVTPYPDIKIKIDPGSVKIKMVVTEN